MLNETIKRILVVDDEDRIRKLLRMYLQKENYEIEEAADGKTALEMALQSDYDLILLDLMMPEMNGLKVCSLIKEKKNTPILMLTAKGEEQNRIEGFEAGTDDYVVKPFSPREVIFRVKALLRRTAAPVSVNQPPRNELIFPHLTIDIEGHRVIVEETEVNLTPKEYELLLYLGQSPDVVFSREDLLKNVWHYEFFGDLRTVDTHVKRLREKLKQSSIQAAEMIQTVWGIGYKLVVPE